jgi:hypothetical protein
VPELENPKTPRSTQVSTHRLLKTIALAILPPRLSKADLLLKFGKQTISSLHKQLSFVTTMMEFRTTGYNGYAVKYSPFVNDKVAVAASANFGLVGNGRLYILGLTANGIVLQRQ